MDRLFREKLYSGKPVPFDKEGRVRMDDWEMRPEIQAAATKLWNDITTETLRTASDYNDYEAEFLRLFGFGLKGVDYAADVKTDIPFEG
jgi:enoyl-[acyl-carrier protein] reductase/trans-2-enoyl-CoA reductase (NAD+)